MATGRTVKRHSRFYMDGYDLSGYASDVGELPWEYDEATFTCLTDEVTGRLPNQCTKGIKEFRGVFDNTATNGLHVLTNAAGVSRNYLYALGIRGAPAQGDPVYLGRQYQLSYQSVEDAGAILASLKFGEWDVGNLIAYDKPWGVLLHAKGAETAVNSAVGYDGLAATTKGGYMSYQVFAASGAGHTATIKVQDAAVNVDGSFADITNCTTGVIDVGTAPISGIVAIGTTATVRQYLRWQIVLGTATSVTFALAFVRG